MCVQEPCDYLLSAASAVIRNKYEIAKIGEKTSGFAHVLAYNAPKTPFFAHKYLTRYTHETFFEKYTNFEAHFLSHCWAIPLQSFGSHIRPQPHGLGLIMPYRDIGNVFQVFRSRKEVTVIILVNKHHISQSLCMIPTEHRVSEGLLPLSRELDRWNQCLRIWAEVGETTTTTSLCWSHNTSSLLLCTFDSAYDNSIMTLI